MKLQDFLSTKAKCIKELDPRYFNSWDFGETYDISITIQVTDKNNDDICFEPQDFLDHFEPVMDSAENPLQDMKLTPKFETEASEPKFEVGDKVYVGLTGKIAQVTKIIDDDVVNVANKNNEVRAWISNICHATTENYERLQATFPHIEFEKPPTQADIDNEAVDKLAQAMKDKLAEKREQGYHGWETCKHGDLVQLLINHVDKGDPIDVANFCAFLFTRGEGLTQEVLDE